ncbi:unnamed protein product [Rhizophagus irregularis]|uniref:DNA helicase Pif1-like 2B domain-containing protein n=1 Tax=Rhizophagus irregularis TaxID=588596 RepID=A0A915ZJL8_9GLOM|nr:unnamed protein product [Rhizophagus irregularis]CAB5379328.1 unnamed protein product [Rhizophagus irregularis]
MNQFPTGEAFEYLSADTVEEADDQCPQEFLNSLTVSGLPPHKLILKLETLIILLRNLQPNDGLCKWTKLVCRTFQKHDIEVEIITENHPGTRVFIPRIMMSPSETDLPFIFKRRSICNDHK